MSKFKLRGFEEHVNVPVTVELAEDKTVEFTVTFKRVDRKRLEEVVRDTQELSVRARDLEQKKILASDQKARMEINKDIEKLGVEGQKFIMDGVVGWKEYYDADDKEVPFSRAILKQFMDHPAYYRAFDAAFWSATGERLKN